MIRLEEKVRLTLERHRMLQAGDRVAVAVSGGADSLALLLLLLEVSRKLSFAISVAHFNHRLRGEESDEDENFVRSWADRSGLKCFVDADDVRKYAAVKKMNEEAAARECRYRFLRGLVQTGEATKIAVAHTANDQAETVLMRLMRGAGMRGLASIRPVVEGCFIRPLLEVTREEIEGYLKSRGLEWREDSTNRDIRRWRNRIRHEMLPQFQVFNPSVISQLARTARLCEMDDRFLTQVAREVFRDLGQRVPDHGIPREMEASHSRSTLSCTRLLALDPSIRSRVIRFAIEEANGDLLRIDEVHVEAVEELMTQNQSGSRITLPFGLCIERVFDELHFFHPSKEGESNVEFEVELPIPGRVELAGRGLVWEAGLQDRSAWLCESRDVSGGQTLDAESFDAGLMASFDYNRILARLDSGSLRVRNVRAGDGYHPLGARHWVKVNDLLSERKVAASLRESWPVLLAGQHIVWVRGCRESADAAPHPGSERILVIREVNEYGH
ncbi:MAG: tRNA lysidine(34) synthetase TilS [Acidobacteriia bacterium]|nr:tRNA lysidine(34) synthetase TilS [Terriglobia bacterium]